MIGDIEELFVHDKDMPKSCGYCFAEYNGWECAALHETFKTLTGKKYECNGEKPLQCPLKSIEEHDNALKERYSKAMKEFAEQCKMAYYYEFEECIPSVMADKIDKLLNGFLEKLK